MDIFYRKKTSLEWNSITIETTHTSYELRDLDQEAEYEVYVVPYVNGERGIRSQIISVTTGRASSISSHRAENKSASNVNDSPRLPFETSNQNLTRLDDASLFLIKKTHNLNEVMEKIVKVKNLIWQNFG